VENTSYEVHHYAPKVAGGWVGLYNEEFRKLYTSPYIVSVAMSRRKGWMGHIERVGDMRNAYKILADNPEGKSPLGRLGVDGKIMLELTLGKYARSFGLNAYGS
jgi:hypothetical protein